MGNCFITRRGGGSPQGFFPSLFVTGLEQTDTCTATCNGKSFVGEWTTKTVESEEKALIPTMTSDTTPSGVCFADSYYSNSLAPYCAFDGNSSTRWNNKETSSVGYIGYTFPSAKRVTRITLTPIANAGLNNAKFQARNNDSEDWVDIATLGNTTTTATENTFTFDNDSFYKSYRIYGSRQRSGSDYMISLYNIQFYGYEEASSTSGFSFPRLTELGTYTVSNGASTMDILVDAPIEYTLEWSTIPRNNLVAEYLFDGDTTDTSPNGNDLTNSGVTFSNNVGVFSGSAYAQASSGVIPTNSPLSISFWVKTTMTSDVDFISTTLSHSGNGIIADKSGFYLYYNGTTESIGILKTITDGVWHHLVFTLETNTMKVYVDGELNNQGTPSGYLSGNTSNFTVGKNTWNNFTGSLDNIRIYSRVLTDTEIATLYDEGGVIHPRTYLYKEGNECSELTGGWSASGWTWQSQTVSGSITKNANDITVVGNAWLGTQGTINLSNYEKLVVECEVNNTSCGLCVNTTKYITGGGTKFVQPMTSKTVVDISTVSTSQYIGFGSYNSNTTVKVKNVWLE